MTANMRSRTGLSHTNKIRSQRAAMSANRHLRTRAFITENRVVLPHSILSLESKYFIQRNREEEARKALKLGPNDKLGPGPGLRVVQIQLLRQHSF